MFRKKYLKPLKALDFRKMMKLKISPGGRYLYDLIHVNNGNIRHSNRLKSNNLISGIKVAQNPGKVAVDIELLIREADEYHIKLLDDKGKTKFDIDEGLMEAGYYRKSFDAHELTNGTYFVLVENHISRSIKRLSIL
jgi:hypothetical protein